MKGCAYCCQDCRRLPVDEASRHDLGRQLPAGATRLELRCPFPEVVPKVLRATTKKGQPREPTMALLEIESVPTDHAKPDGRQQVSALLSLPPDQLPPLRIKWSRLTKGLQGELWGCCPTVPSDLEASVGSHIDTKDPPHTARVFGSLHQKPTHTAVERGVE